MVYRALFFPLNFKKGFLEDFHWFDARPDVFRAITEDLIDSEFICTLGNVEKQLTLDDTSCGCNYPAWVDSETPLLANLIYQDLLKTAQQDPKSIEFLTNLSEEIDITIDDKIIRLVHGEPGNLNGWDLAREHVLQTSSTFEQMCIDNKWCAIACTHTCLPYYLRLQNCIVLNNGALGMPNLEGSVNGLCGAITNNVREKIPGTVCSATVDGLKYALIELPNYDHDGFVKEFLSIWPKGSAAHESYFKRISKGTHLQKGDLEIGIAKELL